MNVTFSKTKNFCHEKGGTIPVVEGASVTFTCTFWGNVSSVSATVLRKGTDVTSTVMPSGAVSTSGNNATLKALTALTGGFDYIVNVTATVDGDVHVKKIRVLVARPKDGV